MEPQETVEQPRKKQKQHHPTGHEQSVKRATVEWFFDGDSPELMPLDNQLFLYYEHAMKQHIALTRDMPIGHGKRFGIANKEELTSTMECVWNDVAPRSDQIVRDISYFPKALDAIIDAEGAKVADVDIRKGRRATRRLDVHADCHEALEERAKKWALLDP